jgi:hypothetical protein
MAAISAGVKGAADVNSQPRQPTKFGRMMGTPASWTYVWVGGAFVYLAMTYFGIARVSRLG